MDPLPGALLALSVGIGGAAAISIGLFRYRRPTTPEAQRRTLAHVNVFALATTVGGFLLFGVGDAVLGALPGGEIDRPASLLLSFLLATVASIPALAVGGVLGRSVVSGDDAADAARTVALGVGVTGGTLAVATVVLAVAAGVGSLIAVAVVPPATFLFLGAVAPRITLATQKTAPRTAAPDDVIDRALDATGYDADRILLIEDAGATVWRPFTKGYGPSERVFVPTDAFDRYDDEVLETLLVMLAGTGRIRLYRTLTWGVALGGTLAIVLVGEAITPVVAGLGLLALFGSVPAAVWVGRRLVYRRDAAVADRVGRERVVDAFLAQDRERGEEGPPLVVRLFHMAPSLDRRIEHLGGRRRPRTRPDSPPRTGGKAGSPAEDSSSRDRDDENDHHW